MKLTKTMMATALGLLLGACVSHVGNPVVAPVSSMPRGMPTMLPAPGDVAVYRILNAYNSEPRGEIRYRVEKVDAGQVVVSMASESTSEALPHTQRYTPDGNWLRHPVVNHDIPVEYEFNPPYPAYAFPLEVGKSWSRRVSATNAAGARVSVRVDGRVLGVERITVPAGSFDTFKIRRQVYAGDWGGFLDETNIREIDWYAPELGRPVRTERNSTWIDLSRTMGGGLFGQGFMEMRGDWSVYELIRFTRGQAQ